MDLRTAETRPRHSVHHPKANVHGFDAEFYRTKMVRYIGEESSENRIFFDALRFADELHSGQSRKSGAPYISHPCAVAEILVRELQIKDPIILASALLHDVVEDIPSIRFEDIQDRFGTAVAELVDGCTKLTRHHLDRATLKDLTHSKILLSASRRLGVLIIKLADRLHNLRTLHYLPKSKRQRIAQETVEVYAPLAAKLNIFPVKRELYHLALSYLYPRKSKKILQAISGLRNSPEVAEFYSALQKAFSDVSYPVTIRPRAKGLGSYYNPPKRTLDLANAENNMDFAIIVESGSIQDCYSALGIVNTTFPPIPRTLRDFIANPKNNGYRSIHVRLHVGGQNYLIKIRTPEMDRFASYGILSHWDVHKPLGDDHWNEVSELLRSIGEYAGAGPQRKALIRLSETEEIFVYSPKGDIYYLPKGSVVLDFAYKIHSEIGDHCDGAWVNGEGVPPTRGLKDGDTVEVFTSPEALDVDPDLEELCKTPKARTAINKRLQQKRLRYAEDVGRQILLQEIRRHGVPIDILEGENADLILEVLNMKDISELYVRLGQDLISPHLVLYYFKGSTQRERDHSQTPASPEITPHERNILHVGELDKSVHKFARCCNPYPGQNHVVATFSERGVTFHHEDCKDLLDRHDLQPQGLLDVEWNKDDLWRYPLAFDLSVLRETLSSLMPSLANLATDIFIRNLETTTYKREQSMVRMNVVLRGFREAEDLFQCLPGGRVSIENYRREGRAKHIYPSLPHA